MALGRTYSVALVGLNGYIVEVEADIGQTVSTKRHMRSP
jgi:magnesium chelatase family protein